MTEAFPKKYRRILWFTVLILPCLVWTAVEIDTNTADISIWLPDIEEARADYSRLTDLFGGDEWMMISWEGCELDDPRLPVIRKELSLLTSKEDPRQPLFHEILTGPELIDQLTGESSELSRTQAIDRLKGTFIGLDGKSTMILCQSHLKDPSGQQIHENIFRILQETGKIPRNEIHLAGSIYEGIVIDEISNRSFRTFLIPSALISLIIGGWALRGLRLILVVSLLAVFCQLMAMAIVYLTVGHLNAVMIVLPTLMYVLTISGGVHLVHYYRNARSTSKTLFEATEKSVSIGWFPCTLASVSTAFGLGSLYVSRIRPLREFGLFSAVCLMIALLALLKIFPALIYWVENRIANKTGATLPELNTVRESEIEKSEPKKIDKLAGLAMRFPNQLAFAGFLFVSFMGFGLTRMQADVQFTNMFRQDSEIVQNYEWLERTFGPMMPVELLLESPADMDSERVNQMQTIKQITKELHTIWEGSGVLSASVFLPLELSDKMVGGLVSRRILEHQIERNFDDIVSSGYVRETEKQDIWRITLRVSALKEIHYSEISKQLREIATEQCAKPNSGFGPTAGVSVTGLAALMDGTRRQLLVDLLNSFSTAFVMIVPVLIVALKGFRLGLMAMLPNLAPILIVFGGMGWIGYRVDIGAVLCASVALGIAVDDTLHFLTWFKRGRQEGMENEAAVRYAYRHCATAMIQTTLICGLGILVFGFSDFAPTSQFAWLLALQLAVALYGDLILLPALLLSGLGRWCSALPPNTNSPTSEPEISERAPK